MVVVMIYYHTQEQKNHLQDHPQVIQTRILVPEKRNYIC